jgi:ubiquinone/menaquinone biosynthesis C-methylase UbiE
VTITFHDSPDQLGRSLGDARRVLVLGTADDAFAAAAVLGEGGSVVGVGLSDEERAVASRRRPGDERVIFEHGHPELLPVEDGSLDAVVATPPVALSQRRGVFLNEVARALRADGQLVVIAASAGT